MEKETLFKFSLKYFIAFLLLFGTEVYIALFVKNTIIRAYIGDVIVVWVIYAFIKSFIAKRMRLLPLYIFIFSVIVEVLQYFKIVELLHLEGNTIARTVIGTSFSLIDIYCYLAGCIILLIWQMLENKGEKRDSLVD